MEPLFTWDYTVTDIAVDRYGRMKPSMILFLAQEVAGQHCNLLSVDYDTLAAKRMFWAVTRHRVQITRLPRRVETIRIETWPILLPLPMPPVSPMRITRQPPPSGRF